MAFLKDTFNNHIGIYENIDEFKAAIEQHELIEPWVAYIGKPGDENYKVIYPNDLVVSDKDKINMSDTILKLTPVICTEDEYDLLISGQSTKITNVDGTKSETEVWYDPEVYYYTWDKSEIES